MDTLAELPELPNQIKKYEADITTEKIIPWIKENLGTCAIEVKATHKKSIPFSAVKEHQLKALLTARTKTLVHKISDAGHVRNPFDIFVLKGESAYVVCCFLHPDDRVALFIPVEEWRGAMSTTRCAYRVKL